MKRLFLCTLLCAISCALAYAIDIPKEHIYIFERSTNSNYVCYDINLQEDGKLNQREPVRGYWVLDEETRLGELTFFERKVAFGIRVVSIKEQEAVVYMTAYKDLKIRVCKHKGKWVGIVKLNGHEMVLQKMFAQMKQSIYPRCEYVDIYGTDIKTGEKRRERIKA